MENFVWAALNFFHSFFEFAIDESDEVRSVRRAIEWLEETHKRISAQPVETFRGFNYLVTFR